MHTQLGACVVVPGVCVCAACGCMLGKCLGNEPIIF